MKEAVRLLVRVDDAGSSWSSNMGCFKACSEGIARSVEVMMPGGWVHHAAKLFNPEPQIDVGIHLTLTSEWDTVRWRPLTPAKSLVDEYGFFLPLLLPREGDDRPNLSEAYWSIEEVAAEFRAQIELGMAMFKRVTHVSSHMIKHFGDFDPNVGDVIADLCAVYGLHDDLFGHGVPRFEGYQPFPRDTGVRTAAFVDRLTKLAEGTSIFIDHPAVPSDELAATGHTGYEDVMEDRRSCLETLVSPLVKQRVQELDIVLLGYGDIISKN